MEVFDHDQIIMNFFYDDLIVDAYCTGSATRLCLLISLLVTSIAEWHFLNKHSRVALPVYINKSG
jgi:hypothetical protein